MSAPVVFLALLSVALSSNVIDLTDANFDEVSFHQYLSLV